MHTEVPWPREITADTKVLTVLYAGMDETAEECREDLVCFCDERILGKPDRLSARAPIWLWLALCSVHGR